MRGVFWTRDGLMSVPEEIGERPLPIYLRPVHPKVTNVTARKTSDNLGPTYEQREYELSKIVEWFDGSSIAYYCEI
jgi:hypothetical protein